MLWELTVFQKFFQVKSFKSVENWVSQLRQYADENIVGCIVGNKIDLPNREVTTHEGSRLAETHGMFYMETSALDGTGVKRAFRVGIRSHLKL